MFGCLIGNVVMDFIFEPCVGLGRLKFDMPKSEVESQLTAISGIRDCDYKDGKLSAFTIDPIDIERLIFCGVDLLKMDKLEVALYLANQSTEYGQAQGGSLYFMDLGCAILQFEAPYREFLFFARKYNTGEPLREMSPYLIESYYEASAGEG